MTEVGLGKAASTRLKAALDHGIGDVGCDSD